LLHPIPVVFKVKSAFFFFKPVDGNCRVFRRMSVNANVGRVIEIKSYLFYRVSPPFQSPKIGSSLKLMNEAEYVYAKDISLASGAVAQHSICHVFIP
jgi:hypothetical protein